MCGRFTLFTPSDVLLYRLGIPDSAKTIDYHPSYNIAPGQPIVSVINDARQNRIGLLQWGLIPSLAKDSRIGYKLINARAETVASKPSFRAAFKSRRCLIVADSFYEWKHDDNNKKVKKPIRFMLKNEQLFTMAGLWETWLSPEGKVIHSATIITTEANEIMAPVHNRMPVILHKDDEQKWIEPKDAGSEQLSLLKPYDSSLMEAYEVSTDVNSPLNNAPYLIERV